jgi:hypothetical protein
MADERAYSGSCHCGAVRLSVPRKPEIVVDCSCSWCAKTGVWWGYFKPSELVVTGDTQAYSNKDRDPAYIALHFCGLCGCSTHWTSLPIWEQDKVGVNMRLFGDDLVAGVELRFSDGKNWNRRDPPGVRRESVVLPW